MPSISSFFAQAFFEAFQPTTHQAPKITNPFIAHAPGLSEGMQQIPWRELTTFFASVEQANGDGNIGLLAYEQAHPRNLGVLGYAVMSSSTVRNALKYIVDYHSLIGCGFCMFLDEQPATLKLVGFAEDLVDLELPRVFIDAIASITLGLLHWLVPNKKIVPIAAEFTYPEPDDTQQLKKMFGPNLKFGANANSLTFHGEDGKLPIMMADPMLQAIHRDYLAMQHRKLVADKMSSCTKSVLLQHLYQALPLTLEDVAKTMSLTPYQLVHSLECEGQSFKKLLDKVKSQKGHLLLTGTDLSLKQISYQLQFKNQSAFNKACERWFGMPPGSYRLCKRLAADHAVD